MKITRLLFCIVIGACLTSGVSAGETVDGKAESGQVTFTILDSGTEMPTACRIHLSDAAGRSVLCDHLPSFRDHFSCPGTAELTLPSGEYTYAIERGPEYDRCSGSFEVRAGSTVGVHATLNRIADLASKGWWSGDLHVHRPVKDMQLLMQAEDLHVAPTLTWWNKSNTWGGSEVPEEPVFRFDDNRFCDILGGEDERSGGAFMYFRMGTPVDITGAEPEYPCPLYFLEQAMQQSGAWIDIEKPFWWDVPVALAHGYGDSIGLLNNHCWRSEMLDNEAWGRPRDKEKFPSPHGNGLWSQHIYYHILNSGIRIAPSAGSASGVLSNPVGYNRVYVYTGGEELDHDLWWENLRKGVCFVTNGPLIMADVAGHKPGHVFQAAEDEEVELEIKLGITSNDPIRSVEVVRNGSVVIKHGSAERGVAGSMFANEGTPLGVLKFKESGWFLVRVMTKVPNTFRFASTAPYYVEIGDRRHHLDPGSVGFFKDWVDERIGRIDINDPAKREEVLKYHRKARQFWLERLAQAVAGAN